MCAFLPKNLEQTLILSLCNTIYLCSTVTRGSMDCFLGVEVFRTSSLVFYFVFDWETGRTIVEITRESKPKDLGGRGGVGVVHW